MQIPFVGFQPIRTSEHMAAAGKPHPPAFSLLGDLRDATRYETQTAL